MKFVFILILALLSISAFSQSTLILDKNASKYEIGTHGTFYEDTSANLTANEIIEKVKTQKIDFKELHNSNFGYTKSVIWRWLVVENQDYTDSDIAILLFDLVATNVDLYVYNQLDENLLPRNNLPDLVQYTGSSVKHKNRPTKNKQFFFRINLKNGDKKLLLFRFKNHQLTETNGLISSFDVLKQQTEETDLGYAFYFGIMGAIFVYNVFLFLFTKNRDFLIYIYWVSSIGILFWGGLGFGDMYTPFPGGWSEILPAIRGVALLTSTVFLYNYVKIKKFLPKMKYILFTIIGIEIVIVLLALVPFKNISGQFFDTLLLPVLLLHIVLAAICAVKGSRQAIFFLASWIPLILSLVVWYLVTRGILPQTPLTLAIVPIGNSFEMLILAFGLADRMNVLQKKLVETLQDAKSNLEERVKERTIELEKSQQSLIYSSKMSSIGLMAQGVAHEINNPLTIHFLYIEQLKKLIKDLDNMGEVDKKNIFTLIDKSLSSINRVKDIVSGLFALSLDESKSAVAKFQFQDSINDVLAVTTEKLKSDQIDFLYEKFSAEVEVLGKRGEIGQVILGLINNAADAVEGLSEKWIKLWVELNSSEVTLFIMDSGTGINENLASKIFEPFFTTKQHKRVVGLGLPISSQMIQRHNGNLRYELREGHTCFVLSLPLCK